MADEIQAAIVDEGGRLSAVIAQDAFGGCAKRTDIAAFIVAFAAEQRVRGLLLGVVAGVIGSVVVYGYVRSKAGKKK